ncbi:MAG: response regulator transcription factor, partial [Oceanococcus sp.]
MSLRILIIDDDPDIQDLLYAALDEQSYILDAASDGPSGLNLATENEYDAIILDINLPGMNGFEICKELREGVHVSTPIMMLTSRSEVEDRIAGLDYGADDYVPKPFSVQELEARLRAMTRRGRPVLGNKMKVSDLELDLESKAASRSGKSIALAPIHIKILALLMRDSPNLVSRSKLEAEIWGDEPPDSDALRAHIYALRTAID